VLVARASFWSSGRRFVTQESVTRLRAGDGWDLEVNRDTSSGLTRGSVMVVETWQDTPEKGGILVWMKNSCHLRVGESVTVVRGMNSVFPYQRCIPMVVSGDGLSKYMVSE